MDQQTSVHPFETGPDHHPANFVPLLPVSFLRRAIQARSMAYLLGQGGKVQNSIALRTAQRNICRDPDPAVPWQAEIK
jgi:hypothetical protein